MLPAHVRPAGRTARSPRRALVAGALLLLALPGCSLRRMAIGAVAKSLAGSGDVYASDGDPELVRDALPFALKTTETLLASSPRDPNLLLAAASGFTQYAWAFVDTDAALADGVDDDRAAALRVRARGLYLRARDYGLRGLELRHPGIGAALQRDPRAAAATLDARDVATAYWTVAAWGAAIGTAKDDPALLADGGVVRPVIERLIVLDDGFGDGALHQAMLALESLPPTMGGSPERARAEFERSVALSHGAQAGPYVSYAAGVSLPAQDRGEFERLLGQALAIDPDAEPRYRLANLIVQRRARALLARADELFLGGDDAGAEETNP